MKPAIAAFLTFLAIAYIITTRLFVILLCIVGIGVILAGTTGALKSFIHDIKKLVPRPPRANGKGVKGYHKPTPFEEDSARKAGARPV